LQDYEIRKWDNVECFNYFGDMINDARCTQEIKSRIAMEKAASTKKKRNLFTSKLDLILRKKLLKFYIWSIALYGGEIWTCWKVDQK
jgi:hypothetical protein